MPDREFFLDLIAAVPARVTDANWRDVAAYRAGYDLLEAGYFWEAHEVWEAVWHRTAPNSREFYLLRALIQFANAALKANSGQSAAAGRIWPLVESELKCVRRCSDDPIFLGISPDVLAEIVLRNRNGGATRTPSLECDRSHLKSHLKNAS